MLQAAKNSLFVAQQGSGKTLAYLLPIVSRLNEQNTNNFFPVAGAPRLLVITPSRELSDQVRRVVSHFLHQADFHVTTLSLLRTQLETQKLSLKHCTALVVDEADCVAQEDEASKIFERVLKKVNKQETATTSFVTATRTAHLVNLLKELKLEPTTVTFNPHTIQPNLQASFYAQRDKSKLQLVNEVLAERKEKALIFCNTRKSAIWLSKSLKEQGKPASLFCAGLPAKMRQKVLRDFQRTDDSKILVATSLASRGVDIQSLEHVVLFDFPKTVSEFLHQVGRTARAGSPGRVSCLYRNRNLPMIQKIKDEILSKSGQDVQIKKAFENVFKKNSMQFHRFEKLAMRLNARSPKEYKKKRAKLRRSCGLPVRDAVTSPEKKTLIKKWREDLKLREQEKFLRKRRRIPNENLKATPTSTDKVTPSAGDSFKKLNDGTLIKQSKALFQ